MNFFAENLKNKRESLGLTQAQLAEYSSLSVGTIAFLETGKRWAGKATVTKLCKALKCKDIDLYMLPHKDILPSEILKKLSLEQLANYVPPSVALKVLSKALGIEDTAPL